MVRKADDSLVFRLLSYCGAVLLLWSAFYNRYPLVFPDSGYYIFTPKNPDRSAGYYFFIQLTSMRLSLWLVIVAQALITSFLLMRVSCVFLKNNKFKEIIAFVILVLLVVVTDISKYVCWLMPDILTSWIFLGFSLFFLSLKWYDKLFAISVICLSLSCHNSHILIAVVSILLLSVIGFIYRSKKPSIWDVSKKLGTCIFIILLAVCALGFLVWGKFSIFPPQKGKFIIAKFTNYSLLFKTLNTYCPTKEWKMCEYKKEIQSIEGQSPGAILWHKESPFVKHNLFKDEKELEEVMFCALKSNISQVIKYSFRDTFKLLARVNSSEDLSQYDGWMIGPMKRNFPKEFKYFRHSNQSKKLPIRVKILFLDEQYLQICIWVYFLIAMFIFILFKEDQLALVMIFVLLFLFLNALITASISGVFGRYNMRVAWLMPYMLLLTSFVFIGKRCSEKDRNVV